MGKIALVLIFAFLVGCVYIYPDARLIHGLKGGYRGIAMTGSGDELFYLGTINAFYKGNFTLSGFDNYEYSGKQPWTFGFFPQAVLGCAGKILGISAVQLDILMSFLLPGILFALLFCLILRLSGGSFFLGLSGALAILLGYPLFTSQPHILKSIFSLKYAQPLWFLRPISPQANHIVLILALLFIYEAISLKTKQAALVLISGLLAGALFYTFIYYWTFVYAGLFVLAGIFVFKKDFNCARKIAFIFLLSLLVSLPYWINYRKLIHFHDYETMEYLNNVVNSHRPSLPFVHLVFLLLFFLAYYRKKINLNFCYMAAFLIGGIICVNQQVFSGKTLFPGHWLGYSNKTFIIIALFASLGNFKENHIIKGILNRRSARITIISILIFGLFFLAFIQQNNFFKANLAFYRQKQTLADVFSWLRGHAEKNSVVLTDPYNFYLRKDFPEPADLLAYTDSFAFLPVSIGTLRSRQDLEDRLILGLAIFGYNHNEVEKFITYANGVHFLGMRATAEYGDEKISKGYIAALRNKFTSLNRPDGLLSKLGRYRLDYMIARKGSIDAAGLSQKFPNSVVVFENGEFIIFKFNLAG